MKTNIMLTWMIVMLMVVGLVSGADSKPSYSVFQLPVLPISVGLPGVTLTTPPAVVVFNTPVQPVTVAAAPLPAPAPPAAPPPAAPPPAAGAGGTGGTAVSRTPEQLLSQYATQLGVPESLRTPTAPAATTAAPGAPGTSAQPTAPLYLQPTPPASIQPPITQPEWDVMRRQLMDRRLQELQAQADRLNVEFGSIPGAIRGIRVTDNGVPDYGAIAQVIQDEESRLNNIVPASSQLSADTQRTLEVLQRDLQNSINRESDKEKKAALQRQLNSLQGLNTGLQQSAAVFDPADYINIGHQISDPIDRTNFFRTLYLASEDINRNRISGESRPSRMIDPGLATNLANAYTMRGDWDNAIATAEHAYDQCKSAAESERAACRREMENLKAWIQDARRSGARNILPDSTTMTEFCNGVYPDDPSKCGPPPKVNFLALCAEKCKGTNPPDYCSHCTTQSRPPRDLFDTIMILGEGAQFGEALNKLLGRDGPSRSAFFRGIDQWFSESVIGRFLEGDWSTAMCYTEAEDSVKESNVLMDPFQEGRTQAYITGRRSKVEYYAECAVTDNCTQQNIQGICDYGICYKDNLPQKISNYIYNIEFVVDPGSCTYCKEADFIKFNVFFDDGTSLYFEDTGIEYVNGSYRSFYRKATSAEVFSSEKLYSQVCLRFTGYTGEWPIRWELLSGNQMCTNLIAADEQEVWTPENIIAATVNPETGLPAGQNVAPPVLNEDI